MIEIVRGDPDEVTLRDGTPGHVWPLLPTDRARLAEEFADLSTESRRRRFLAPVAELSDTMLDHLVDDVDGVDHVALVLFVEVGEAVEPIAIGRMVRYAAHPGCADVAVTVKDAWQGRGAATALLQVLNRRRPEGVTHLLTEVMEGNPASLAMLRRLGPVQTSPSGPGTLGVEVQLDDAPSPLSTAQDPQQLARQLLSEPGRTHLRGRDRLCPWLGSDQSEPVGPES